MRSEKELGHGYQRIESAEERAWTDIVLLQVSPQEMTEVVTAFKDTSDVKKVQSTGLHIAGEKFIVLKADDRSLYGKKVWLTTQLCSGKSVY
jgi:hypothetical protein